MSEEKLAEKLAWFTVGTERELFAYRKKSAEAGASTLGFQEERRRSAAISRELGLPAPAAPPGTCAALLEYLELLEAARYHVVRTGKRMTCGLHPDLTGLEGSTLEATRDGEKVRFILGKSTGFIPCHLEVAVGKDYGDAIHPEEDLGRIKVIRRAKHG
jgi:hypothetical protein